MTSPGPQAGSAALLPWLLALAALLLGACAAPPAVPTPAPTTAPTATTAAAAPTEAPTATAAPTAEPAAAAPTPQPAALTLWAVAPEPRREALGRLLAELAQAQGVELSVVFTSADGLSADVRAAQVAGLPLPDLVWGNQDDLGILQRAGVLQPAADGLSPDEYLPAVIDGATVAGARWGTPVAAQGALLLLYNRKLVDGAPATTNELIARSRQLTGGGRYGLVAGWAEARWFAAYLHGTGGATLGPDGAPSLDAPETVAALDLLKALRRAGPPPPSSYDQGARLFRDGKAAYAIDGDWSLDYYRRYTETLDLAIAPMPRVNATGRQAIGPLGGVYLLYGAQLDGPRRDGALALGRALAAPERQARIARGLGMLPALRAAAGDPAVTSDPALAAAAAGARDAPAIPPLDALRCAWDAVEVTLPSAILGDLTTAEAAARMQERAAVCR